jgi:hypothetical protein
MNYNIEKIKNFTPKSKCLSKDLVFLKQKTILIFFFYQVFGLIQPFVILYNGTS